MNRNLRLGTLITALLLVTAAMSIGPRPAHAICPCDTANTYVTDCWGKGSSCTAAVSNLPSACTTIATNACWDMGYDGSCQVSSVQNSPYYCWFDSGSGMWVVDGRVTFRCKTCIDINPDPKLQ